METVVMQQGTSKENTLKMRALPGGAILNYSKKENASIQQGISLDNIVEKGAIPVGAMQSAAMLQATTIKSPKCDIKIKSERVLKKINFEETKMDTFQEVNVKADQEIGNNKQEIFENDYGDHSYNSDSDSDDGDGDDDENVDDVGKNKGENWEVDNADDCIYIGATHYINLLSSDDEEVNTNVKIKNSEANKVEEQESNSDSDSEISVNNENENDDNENINGNRNDKVNENEKQFHVWKSNGSECKAFKESAENAREKLIDKSKTVEEEAQIPEDKMADEQKIDKKIILETALKVTEKSNSTGCSDSNKDFSKVTEQNAIFEAKKLAFDRKLENEVFEKLNIIRSADLNMEIPCETVQKIKDEEKVHNAVVKNEEKKRSKKENVSNLNSSYFAENNCEEIFPELGYIPNLENNLSDVNAMEKELDHALEEIDAKAKVKSEKISIQEVSPIETNDLKLKNNENETNKNHLEPNVIWSATQGLNRSIFEPKESVSAAEESNLKSLGMNAKATPGKEYESESEDGDGSSSSGSSSDSDSSDESSSTEESEVESGELRDSDEEPNLDDEPMAKKAKCEN